MELITLKKNPESFLIGTKEAARIIGIPYSTLLEWEGVPRVKRGVGYYYNKEILQKFVAESMQDSCGESKSKSVPARRIINTASRFQALDFEGARRNRREQERLTKQSESIGRKPQKSTGA